MIKVKFIETGFIQVLEPEHAKNLLEMFPDFWEVVKDKKDAKE